ncbi:MAG: FecR domain-containing protein [Phycisphaerales bacterium]|nr:FecR domain-containing protein [Hyphomonadaceae bacterium]
MRWSIFALCAVVTALALSPSAFAQNANSRIGAAAAVRNQVTATQSGQERRLAVGGAIFQNESVRTGADSVAQLLFADQTSMSLGPRSEITLDRYVYDPNRSAGDVGVSLTQGALRFVSGRQDPRTYQVRTPVATIGVRGTIVDFLLIDGRMFAILDEGSVVFTLSNGQTLELIEPGMALEFFSDGTASRPFTWRGRYEASLGTATFPLFGNPFAETPGLEGANNPDDATNRIDELDTRDLFQQLPTD